MKSAAKLDLNFVERLLLLAESEFVSTLTEWLPLLLSDLQNDDGGSDEFHSLRIKVLERYFTGEEKSSHGTDVAVNRYATINEIISTLVNCFVESMCRMENELRNGSCDDDVESPVDGTLGKNIRLLNCVKMAITYLGSVGAAVDVECVPDTPKSVLTIMLKTFEHCKNMESLYSAGQQLDSVKTRLTTLLGECHELQRIFFAFLNKLNVNCQFERQFQLLTDMLEMMFGVGAVVISLDLKTMAEQWKGYTNLLKRYSSALRKHFDISKTVNFLLRQITDQVTLMDGGGGGDDQKFLNLTSKISCFLLKIVTKLCEYFSDCLHDCVVHLFEFILFVNGYSYCASDSASGARRRNLAVVEKVESCLLPGVEPLVKLLVAERQFARHYAKIDTRQVRSSGRSIEFLTLSRCILRQLLSCPSEETYRLWTETECDLLACVLRAVCHFEEQLCYQVKVDLCSFDTSGAANLTREVSLYDDLLINVSALIITRVDEKRFSHVEELLVSHLFCSESHLASLFVCDLWCVLARYGSANLCFQHVRYLITVFHQVEHVVGVLKRTLLASLVKRIFAFLTGSQQLEILSSALRLDEELYAECCAVLAASVKANLSHRVAAECMARCKETTTVLGLANTVANFEADLDAFSVSFLVERVVVQHWSRCRPVTTHRHFQFHLNTLASLCELTRVLLPRTSNAHFSRILQSISYLCKCDSIFVKLCCVSLLKHSSHYELQTQVNEICNALAVLFRTLLKDENPIVKERCLEAFTYFAHFTSYEKVISSTTSADKRITEHLSSYIHRQPHKQILSKPWHRYLSSLRSEAKDEENSFRNPVKMHQPPSQPNDDSFPSKRIKLDNNILDDFNRLESNLTTVLDHLKGHHHHHLLTEQEKCILNRSLTIANEIRKFI